MSDAAALTIDFHGDWHCGTGRGSAANLDAVAARDPYGLPCVPGKTIRGILRESVRRLATHGHAAEDSVALLFGDAGFRRDGAGDFQPARWTRPGRLTFSDARLDRQIGLHLRYLEETDGDGRRADGLRATLFRSVQMTAVDTMTGAAANKSLRIVEAAVPLTLTAQVACADASLDVTGAVDMRKGVVADWFEVLRRSFAFVDGIGAYRTRGFGRCSLSLTRGAPA